MSETESEFEHRQRALFMSTQTAHSLCLDGKHDEAAVVLQAALNGYNVDE